MREAWSTRHVLQSRCITVRAPLRSLACAGLVTPSHSRSLQVQEVHALPHRRFHLGHLLLGAHGPLNLSL